MKEWNNQFNSFNSNKGLLYGDWYKAVKDRKFLPPIEASLDPIHACNLACSHCNASRYLTDYNGADRRMTDDHLMNLVEFLADWGVSGCCFGGGGEPTMHTKLGDALLLAKQMRMESSIATNGTLLTDELINIVKDTCRWIGISIDAASRETYKIGRKEDLFDKALHNIQKMAKAAHGTKCDVSYKFLIFDYNQHEIFRAAKIAKSIGAKDFHARPADFSHQGMGDLAKKSDYDIKHIEEQFIKCHELEDKDFRVFTVIHKFDQDYKPKKLFSQCYAAPICIQLCADGNVYFCPDTRHKDYYKLGSHYPDPENILNFWGDERHQDLVFNCGKEHCKSRCTFNVYNQQCEELFIKEDDPFCKNFV